MNQQQNRQPSNFASQQQRHRNQSQNLLTENEVQSILQNCNLSLCKQLKQLFLINIFNNNYQLKLYLEQVTIEHDDCLAEIKKLEKEIQNETLQIVRLEKEWKQIQVEATHSEKLCEKLQEDIEEKKLIQNLWNEEIEFKKTQQQKNEFLTLKQQVQNQEMNQENKQIILAFLDDSQQIYEKYSKLNEINEVLENYISSRSNNIQKIEQKKKVQTYCNNCKELYIPAENHAKACYYHPGRLKYYSCRGCGADDYFNCCMKCSKCCKGCIVSFHVS